MAPYTTKNLMEKFQEQLDMERYVDVPDDRDPRSWGWPCGGHDEATQILFASNPHAVYGICARCGIRLRYAPKLTKPGTFRAAGPLPAHVAEAQYMMYTSGQPTTYVNFQNALREAELRARQGLPRHSQGPLDVNGYIYTEETRQPPPPPTTPVMTTPVSKAKAKARATPAVAAVKAVATAAATGQKAPTSSAYRMRAKPSMAPQSEAVLETVEESADEPGDVESDGSFAMVAPPAVGQNNVELWGKITHKLLVKTAARVRVMTRVHTDGLMIP